MYVHIVMRWICLLVVLVPDAAALDMQLFDSLSRDMTEYELGN